MNKLTIIHLVSGQTMQNLLPLIALRPQRVIQICSNDARFAQIAKHIENAAIVAEINAEFHTQILDSDSPDVESVRNIIKETLARFPTDVVNITGGTKLMSLGAYLGASEHIDVSILYCDTFHKRFVHVGGKTFPPKLPEFQKVSASLSLSIVMAAHGKSPDDWKFDTASDSERDFGQASWELRCKYPTDLQDFCDHVRSFYRSENGRIPNSRTELDSLVAADLTKAFSGELSEPVRNYLDAAKEAGFLIQLPSGGYSLAGGPDKKRGLQRHVERISNLLVGSWLELSVLSFISRCARYRDPHWSVEATKQGQPKAEYGETDIVAIDTNTSSLEIISCKTSLGGKHGPQPLEHLEGLRTRATNLGGSHARATLALFNPSNPKEILKLGRALNVEVLISEEIRNYFI